MKTSSVAFPPVDLPGRHSQAGDPALFQPGGHLSDLLHDRDRLQDPPRLAARPVWPAQSIHVPEHHRRTEQRQYPALVREQPDRDDCQPDRIHNRFRPGGLCTGALPLCRESLLFQFHDRLDGHSPGCPDPAAVCADGEHWLINTLPSVIIIYSGLLIPFSVYLLVSFFRSLPPELFDAAAIDGCSNLDTFWRITLPLIHAGHGNADRGECAFCLE